MSRPRTPQMTAALADVQAGLSARIAAKKNGVSESALSRAINPKPKPTPTLCKCCGQRIK